MNLTLLKINTFQFFSLFTNRFFFVKTIEAENSISIAYSRSASLRLKIFYSKLKNFLACYTYIHRTFYLYFFFRLKYAKWNCKYLSMYKICVCVVLFCVSCFMIELVCFVCIENDVSWLILKKSKRINNGTRFLFFLSTKQRKNAHAKYCFYFYMWIRLNRILKVFLIRIILIWLWVHVSCVHKWDYFLK